MVREKLSVVVTKQMLDLINKEFFPGDKIPNEEELCERFQVSRTTIREAIKDLTTRNILEVKRGNGTYVCDTPGVIDDPMGWRFLDREQFSEDMNELGRILDPSFVRIAAQKERPEKFKNLQEAQDQFAERVRAYENGGDVSLSELLLLDVNVHKAIMLCCDNLLFERIFDGTYDSLRAIVPVENFAKAVPSCVRWHQNIIDLIKAHKDEEGAKAMEIHLEEVGNAYFPKE